MFTEHNKSVSVLFRVNTLYQQSYNLQRLLNPNRLYRFQVLAFTSIEENETYSSEIKAIMTSEGVPSVAPPNVRLRNMQDGVLVLWDPVESQYANGQIQGYRVYYRRQYYYYYYYSDVEKNSTTDANVLQVALRDLESGKRYEITVTAFTSAGEGPRSQRLTITYVSDCGSNFNQSFGTITIFKSDYSNNFNCNWTIGSVGISNAVGLLTIHGVYPPCREFVTVYSSNGSKVFGQYGCYYDLERTVQIPFGEGHFVTVQTYLYSYSRLTIHFAVLRGNLNLALSHSTPWNILGFNTSETSLLVEWNNLPGDLQPDFFILSMIQTRPTNYYWSYSDNVNWRVRILNSSLTSLNVSDLPGFSRHRIRVYAVNVSGDLYKSEQVEVETDEMVPLWGPYVYRSAINIPELSVSYRIGIYPSYVRGRLLGYKVIYAPMGEPKNKRTMQVGANFTRVTLRHLKSGFTYVVAVAAFNRKGTGRYTTVSSMVCGGSLVEDSGFLSSPAYFDHAARCNWRIKLSSMKTVTWLTIADFILGIKDVYGSCRGGVHIFTSMRNGSERQGPLEICGIVKNKTWLIQGSVLNLTADGFRYNSEDLQRSSFLVHYKTDFQNITTIIGEEKHLWSGMQFRSSESSIDFSWTPPPRSLLGVSSVQNYIILYDSNPINFAIAAYSTLWLAGNETSTNIAGLQPFTNYSLIVIAILDDNNRRINTGWIRVQTEEGVPARNPYIWYARAISYNTVWIKWERLLQRYTRGILRGYRIYVSLGYHYYYYYYNNYHRRCFRSINVAADKDEMRISGLRSDTYYSVWVKALTSKGEGGYENIRSVRTRCGAAIQKGSDIIQSRGFPHNIEYSDCTWELHPEGGNKSVLLTFERFSLPLSFRCENFYVSVSDDADEGPDLLCGEKNPFTILAGKLRIHYRSTRYSSSWQGFQARYVILNDSLTNAPQVQGWNANITIINSSTIDVTWAPYVPDSAYSVHMYAVICVPISYEATPIVVTANNAEINLQVRRLRGFVEYRVQVLALTMQTVGRTLMSLKGSQKRNILTAEGVPSRPPGNVTTLSAHEHAITVSWSYIQHATINGVLQGL
ncbi:phosphatidylinositol phosphatase PTPRQ-like [Montipora capricornis]|uniref:phosphatidylinositol phosphatase PTPRQ-like n=1 Tax=Montipora capricornis TaxID=246305 RepID=UPI0035F0FBC6